MATAHQRNDPARTRFYDSAGRAIREAREAGGYSQREMGELVGVAQCRLGHIEAGLAECPFHVAARIADVLDLTIDDLAPVLLDEKEDA